MPTPLPTRVIVAFDDGSQRETAWHDLPGSLGAELLRQPFAVRPAESADDRRFALVEWEDGWREVVAVDPRCTEVNRYRVLTRPEAVGRLSLNRSDGYPELIEIDRRPERVRRVTFNGTYQLEPSRSVREGRKTEQHFALRESGDETARLAGELARLLAEEGVRARDLIAADPASARDRFEGLRRKLGLNASFCQQDVLDFVALLTRIVAEQASP